MIDASTEVRNTLAQDPAYRRTCPLASTTRHAELPTRKRLAASAIALNCAMA
jgi:hypothetical protein